MLRSDGGALLLAVAARGEGRCRGGSRWGADSSCLLVFFLSPQYPCFCYLFVFPSYKYVLWIRAFESRRRVGEIRSSSTTSALVCRGARG